MSGRCGDTCCRCAVWPSRRSFCRLYCTSIQPGTAGEPAMRCPLHLSAPAPSPSTRQANCFHFSHPCSRQAIVSLRSFADVGALLCRRHGLPKQRQTGQDALLGALLHVKSLRTTSLLRGLFVFTENCKMSLCQIERNKPEEKTNVAVYVSV